VQNQLFNFIGGNTGVWQVIKMETVVGAPLAQVERVEIIEGELTSVWQDFVWSLSGVTSYGRYVTRAEKDLLASRQADLNRPEATCAALIPISKSEIWWNLAQDERRAILETKSEHIKIGLEYLPAIARRLHHCRELDGEFDFLTWFEFAPEHSEAFEELVVRLHKSEEWKYVVREIDIRLVRADQ
jgi:chlorite dismutase